MPSPRELSQKLKAAARSLGFDLAGIAPAVTPDGFSRLTRWIEQGYAGAMEYIPRRAAAYEHPEYVLEGARSVILTAMNYAGPKQRPQPSPHTPQSEVQSKPQSEKISNAGLRIASYAQIGQDYHDLLKARLQKLAAVLHTQTAGCRTRCVVDTAPLLERDFARLAGLGWFGKNTMLIHKQLGSFFFLGAVLTDVELEPDEPHHTSHCGTCTACLDICPTQAFPEPGVLDARRCISYLTIELKQSIPRDLRPGMQNWMFGCDLCQDVCPWNRKSPLAGDPEFQPQPALQAVDAVALLLETDDQLKRRFKTTPLSRAGPVGLKRNAAIVLGNARNLSAIPALCRGLDHEDPIVRGACVWALGQLPSIKSHEGLNQRLLNENNPDVIEELTRALAALDASPLLLCPRPSDDHPT